MKGVVGSMSVRQILESIGAAVEIGILLPLSPLLRMFYNRAATTHAEQAQGYPFDKLVPNPRQMYTRAITIDAPPAIVWGYLTQIGQERAGMYSYDVLENLVGCDMHTVDHRVPEWQSVNVGDAVRFGPAEKGYPTQKVIAVDPPHTLVWQGVDAKTLEPGEAISSVQAFYLEELPGSRTRLITRSQLDYQPSLAMTLLWRMTEVLNYVMEQKMLHSIKAYAERDARASRNAALYA